MCPSRAVADPAQERPSPAAIYAPARHVVAVNGLAALPAALPAGHDSRQQRPDAAGEGGGERHVVDIESARDAEGEEEDCAGETSETDDDVRASADAVVGSARAASGTQVLGLARGLARSPAGPDLGKPMPDEPAEADEMDDDEGRMEGESDDADQAAEADEEEPSDVNEDGDEDEQSQDDEADNEPQVEEERDEAADEVADVRNLRRVQCSHSSDRVVTNSRARSPKRHAYDDAGDAEAGNEVEDEEGDEEPTEEDAIMVEEEPLELQMRVDDAEEAEEEEDEGDEAVAAETKRRRREALADFFQLEQRFADLRTEVFYERMLSLAVEAELLESGKHREFLVSKRGLEAKLNKRKSIAAACLDLTLEAFANQLEMKRYQADCTFEARKAQLRAALIVDRQTKKFQLMREKRLLDDPPVPSHVLDRATMTKRRKVDKADIVEMFKLRREYSAFPAPVLSGMSEAEVEEDLLQLGVIKLRNSSPAPLPLAAQPRQAKKPRKEKASNLDQQEIESAGAGDGSQVPVRVP